MRTAVTVRHEGHEEIIVRLGEPDPPRRLEPERWLTVRGGEVALETRLGDPEETEKAALLEAAARCRAAGRDPVLTLLGAARGVEEKKPSGMTDEEVVLEVADEFSRRGRDLAGELAERTERGGRLLVDGRVALEGDNADSIRKRLRRIRKRLGVRRRHGRPRKTDR